MDGARVPLAGTEGRLDAMGLMQAALDVATQAGQVARHHFGRGLVPETKSDGSPVTLADREAEQAARTWLAERFPRDGIFGEEFGRERSDAPRQWLVDPIDGTRSFVRGVPLWGTLVACVEDGQVVASAAVFPSAGRAICAARGGGTHADGSRAHVSSLPSLDSALLLATDLEFRGDEKRASRVAGLIQQVGRSRTWGDAYGYLLVATGAAEVMCDGPCQPWDMAPVMLIIEEAGGVFTDWRGSLAWDGAHGGIATNAALAHVVRDRLVG